MELWSTVTVMSRVVVQVGKVDDAHPGNLNEGKGGEAKSERKQNRSTRSVARLAE